ncbi:hypothetical protein ACFS7Z_11155 [Pontibacter toksunensis]|uniref:Glycosyltransferase family 61 protein n=1 Tax=Pontibacter toksunensis TaxID=1332631 RepID=A0ABW6BVE3_9BACT
MKTKQQNKRSLHLTKSMQGLFLNFLSLFTLLKYPSIKKDYRYFIRDNYYSRLLQTKYLIADYIFKKEYKTIQYYGEFQQELTFILPFAYWHHLNGTLKKTISCKDTKELYFFSNNHEERYSERDAVSNYGSYEVPNMTHSISYSYTKWARVPLKEHYHNDTFRYDKPTLVIANKYNIEWDELPVNFFDIETLDEIITKYKDKYQIVYNRPLSRHIVQDNSEILELHEYEWLRENHPEVILISDLYKQHSASVNNFNHLQLLVYANCSHFISVHGGTGALASYFGGNNIILSKKGIEQYFNEYATIFPSLSGARIHHAKTKSDIFRYLEEYY